MSDVLIRFAFASFLLVAGCGGEKESVVRAPAEGGKLVFVTTLRAPPYTYVDEKTKDFAGIDVEIARAAAKKLGLPLEICRKPFEDLLPSVKSGKADFAANALTITPARAKNVNFSHSYARDGSAFLYRAGEPPPTIPRANDLRVGTMMASTCHFYLCYHDIDPYCYGDYAEAFAEFKKGKLDAVFYDAEPIRESARMSNGEYAFTPLETIENYGIAIRKDYPALLEAVNAVVDERRAK